MNWLLTLKKSGLAIITFIVATIAANPSIVTAFIPQDIQQLTIGGLVAALLVGLANWLKHKNEE